MGWDLVYSQLGRGGLNGTFTEFQSPSLLATFENISNAIHCHTSCFPDCVIVAMHVSNEPSAINGLELDSSTMLIAKDECELEMTMHGAGDLFVGYIPETDFETMLDEKLNSEPLETFQLGSAGVCKYLQNWLNRWGDINTTENLLAPTLLTLELKELMWSSIDHFRAQKENGASANPRKSPRAAKSIQQLIDYFYAHPAQLLDTEDMQRVTGVNRRTLFHNFKKFTGYTPYQFSRYVRLNYFRRDLQRDMGTVTDLGHKYGFHNIGELANLYQTTFGELPSNTRRNSLLFS